MHFYRTGNEDSALVSLGMTELYFDHEDADTRRFLAHAMFLMVQSSDADALVSRCSLFLSPDCNALWFHAGMVWFQTGTPDKSGYHPVQLSVFRLEQSFSRHCCPLCTHWL